MTKKIVITGPESSGKTTLTKLLAEEYNTTFVKEYAREYLSTLRHSDSYRNQSGKSYSLDDVLKMAKEQLNQEENAPQQLCFFDTDLTVYAIWIKKKYNLEIDWITQHLKTSMDKLYLLCDVNIKWEEDPLREHPDIKDRKRLFQDYINLLEKYQLPYHIISGDIPTRIKKVKKIIRQLN
ncbi:MAG: ATP-binding protein [Vicingus serpentipes]|nr:ATP-binding protein [Vicingus serpentipes]